MEEDPNLLGCYAVSTIKVTDVSLELRFFETSVTLPVDRAWIFLYLSVTFAADLIITSTCDLGLTAK
jgi:hypothetical protein